MSARHVADMLSIASEGLRLAKSSGDAALTAQSAELAVRALAHPDAAAFFAGLNLALAETYAQADEDPELWGNDPDELDNGYSPMVTDGVVTRRGAER